VQGKSRRQPTENHVHSKANKNARPQQANKNAHPQQANKNVRHSKLTKMHVIASQQKCTS
jgi:hypothetical protein